MYSEHDRLVKALDPILQCLYYTRFPQCLVNIISVGSITSKISQGQKCISSLKQLLIFNLGRGPSPYLVGECSPIFSHKKHLLFAAHELYISHHGSYISYSIFIHKMLGKARAIIHYYTLFSGSFLLMQIIRVCACIFLCVLQSQLGIQDGRNENTHSTIYSMP